MYCLFADESYRKDHYYVAGILVTGRQAQVLENRLNELAEHIRVRNDLPEAPEFHGHALMNGQDDWSFLRGNFGASVRIYQQVLHAIRNAGVRGYLEGVDVKRLNARYRYPDSPHEITLRHVLERVNEHCAQDGQRCRVIADTVPQEDKFKQAIQEFTKIGTPGYRSQRLLCIEGDICFVDSRESRGVQAADMTAYILRRYREENDSSKSVKRATKRLRKALGDAMVYERKWIP